MPTASREADCRAGATRRRHREQLVLGMWNTKSIDPSVSIGDCSATTIASRPSRYRPSRQVGTVAVATFRRRRHPTTYAAPAVSTTIMTSGRHFHESRMAVSVGSITVSRPGTVARGAQRRRASSEECSGHRDEPCRRQSECAEAPGSHSTRSPGTAACADSCFCRDRSAKGGGDCSEQCHCGDDGHLGSHARSEQSQKSCEPGAHQRGEPERPNQVRVPGPQLPACRRTGRKPAQCKHDGHDDDHSGRADADDAIKSLRGMLRARPPHPERHAQRRGRARDGTRAPTVRTFRRRMHAYATSALMSSATARLAAPGRRARRR